MKEARNLLFDWPLFWLDNGDGSGRICFGRCYLNASLNDVQSMLFSQYSDRIVTEILSCIQLFGEQKNRSFIGCVETYDICGLLRPDHTPEIFDRIESWRISQYEMIAMRSKIL